MLIGDILSFNVRTCIVNKFNNKRIHYKINNEVKVVGIKSQKQASGIIHYYHTTMYLLRKFSDTIGIQRSNINIVKRKLNCIL